MTTNVALREITTADLQLYTLAERGIITGRGSAKQARFEAYEKDWNDFTSLIEHATTIDELELEDRRLGDLRTRLLAYFLVRKIEPAEVMALQWGDVSTSFSSFANDLGEDYILPWARKSIRIRGARKRVIPLDLAATLLFQQQSHDYHRFVERTDEELPARAGAYVFPCKRTLVTREEMGELADDVSFALSMQSLAALKARLWAAGGLSLETLSFCLNWLTKPESAFERGFLKLRRRRGRAPKRRRISKFAIKRLLQEAARGGE